jgi:hypothetical protein
MLAMKKKAFDVTADKGCRGFISEPKLSQSHFQHLDRFISSLESEN